MSKQDDLVDATGAISAVLAAGFKGVIKAILIDRPEEVDKILKGMSEDFHKITKELNLTK